MVRSVDGRRPGNLRRMRAVGDWRPRRREDRRRARASRVLLRLLRAASKSRGLDVLEAGAPASPPDAAHTVTARGAPLWARDSATSSFAPSVRSHTRGGSVSPLSG